MPDFKNSTLLVTGASGHLGRLAVQYLLAQGATRVIAATRDTAKIADLVEKGAEARTLDFDDAATLAPAFAGVDRVLLISTNDLGRRSEQQGAAIDAAVAAGVKHIVYTSAPAASPNPGSILSQDHYWTEQKLAATSIGWTALRNHIYAEITLMGAAGAVQSGQSFDATGDIGRNYVWRQDAADTAAAALLKAEGRTILDVTGPAPVTQSEVVQLLSSLSGKPITRVAITGEQLAAAMAGHGMPQPVAEAMAHFDTDAAQGYHAIVTDVVEQFTGRKPQSLSAFLSANKAAFTA